jgi:hypothetical protein
VEAREVVVDIRLGGIDEYARGHFAALPWGAAIAAARPDGVDAATEIVLEHVAAHVDAGDLVAPFASCLVSGRRPT